MIDTFVLLTPFLLLAVIAIFGFVGCGFQDGSANESLTASPPSGPITGGTAITITGSNSDFTSNAVLTFGSSPNAVIADPATVKITSSTTLNAVTPAYPLAQAIDLNVTYTNSRGQSDSASGSLAFTYTKAVTHVQTVIGTTPAGPTFAAPPLTLQGGELLIASLQWAVPSAGGSQATPTFSGALFQPVVGGGPVSWNSMKVQTFFAFNSAAGQVNISATLPQASPDACTLCVTAYDFADPANPIYSPVQGDPTYKGTNPATTTAIAANPGDMVYAVAYAANSGGLFPGTNPLNPGTGFTAESAVGGDPLVEDLSVTAATSVVAHATNTTMLATPRSWIFAMGIKVAG
jgi:hypothetical protein